jgi:hypothetical protein
MGAQWVSAGRQVVVATGKAKGPWAEILPQMGPPVAGVFTQVGHEFRWGTSITTVSSTRKCHMCRTTATQPGHACGQTACSAVED